ncbi:carboxymuconolactone decarboxylase family protein [Yinghuangia sp. YIM S10712]|uniref:carboxymuconolactone decarboxylase family protein n=1 Tax=Yinghuangia sp. YIM S10712 TaxID=3436930 RepID=UPI003F52E417
MARVKAIPPREWPREMREALAALVPSESRHPLLVSEGRPKGLNALGSFAHHPALARAFFQMQAHLLLNTTLTPRQRELLILRVTHLRQAHYEWAQHVHAAQDTGLDKDEIARIADDLDPDSWSPLESALLQATDELVGDGGISDKTWAELSAHLDTQQLMDVIFTVGIYETVSWLFRSLDIDFDDDLRPA